MNVVLSVLRRNLVALAYVRWSLDVKRFSGYSEVFHFCFWFLFLSSDDLWSFRQFGRRSLGHLCHHRSINKLHLWRVSNLFHSNIHLASTREIFNITTDHKYQIHNDDSDPSRWWYPWWRFLANFAASPCFCCQRLSVDSLRSMVRSIFLYTHWCAFWYFIGFWQNHKVNHFRLLRRLIIIMASFHRGGYLSNNFLSSTTALAEPKVSAVTGRLAQFERKEKHTDAGATSEAISTAVIGSVASRVEDKTIGHRICCVYKFKIK